MWRASQGPSVTVRATKVSTCQGPSITVRATKVSTCQGPSVTVRATKVSTCPAYKIIDLKNNESNLIHILNEICEKSVRLLSWPSR